MKYKTGQTVYDTILSVDEDNQPVTGTTFDSFLFLNGLKYTGSTVSVDLSDASRGVYLASWSSNTVGTYNIYIKNSATRVIYISEHFDIYPDSEFEQNIYVGL